MSEIDSRPSPILSCFSGGVSNVLQCFKYEHINNIYSLNILDICYLLFIFVICIQIRRKIAEGHKYTSKKCLIFYLIVVDLIRKNNTKNIFSVVLHLHNFLK